MDSDLSRQHRSHLEGDFIEPEPMEEDEEDSGSGGLSHETAKERPKHPLGSSAMYNAFNDDASKGPQSLHFLERVSAPTHPEGLQNFRHLLGPHSQI